MDLKKLCEPKTGDTAMLIHVDPVNLSGIHLVNESFPNLQTPSSACDELATSLQDAQQQQADGMKSAVEEAYQNVQEVLWDTFSDSLLSYSCPVGTQLEYGAMLYRKQDLLEIYAYPDSRLTEAINEMGGHAQRFTRQDGDLSTTAGQRQLYELLQRTQPKHIWMAPECRFWGSWSNFNGSRSSQVHLKLQADRERDRVHLRLCARIHAWQAERGRHFYLEQPELSRMLTDDTLASVIQRCHSVTVDMCAFGLRTPVSQIPIRKRTVIVTLVRISSGTLHVLSVLANTLTSRWLAASRITTGGDWLRPVSPDLTAVGSPVMWLDTCYEDN